MSPSPLAIWWAERPRPQTLVLTGTVDGNEVVVGSKITGRIVKLAVDDGQWVKAGDLIAVLDQDELRADQGAAGHAIAQARANAQQSVGADRTAAKTPCPPKCSRRRRRWSRPRRNCSRRRRRWRSRRRNCSRPQAQVAQTQAAVAKAQDNFNRIRPLVESDINPPQDLVTAQTDLDSAKANQRAAQAGAEAARRAVAAAQAGAKAIQRSVAAARGGAGGCAAGGTPGRRCSNGRPMPCARPRRRPNPMPWPPTRASTRRAFTRPPAAS